MQEIDEMLARVNAADGLADTLAAGWDAFELIQTIANEQADRSPGTFAAFMFAAAAAADGLDAVGFAASMPATPGEPISRTDPDAHHVDQVADRITALASALGRRLETAAGLADNAADRRACEHAAREAGRIHDLLAPDPA
jgi:hypothetical protein